MHPIEQKINMTDLHFLQMIQTKYGINRGVYNTIDIWLYDSGLRKIQDRRKEMLRFFDYALQTSKPSNKRLKFGRGGLAIKLNEFYQKSRTEGGIE